MGKGKILLIDDNPDMIAIGSQVFVKSGYQYLSALTGQDGLKNLLDHTPDVVVLDYLLPDMKAHEFINLVATGHEYEAVRGTPFVVLTAWEEKASTIKELYGKGLKAYLHKPFGHRELKCVIENIIQLARADEENARSKAIGHAPVYDEEFQDLIQSIIGLSKTLLNEKLGEQQEVTISAIHNSGCRMMKKLRLLH